MKTKLFILSVVLFSFIQSYGQINPIQNLTWDHNYVFQHNYFILAWDEPELPHDDLIGYNVYRDDELYRFQTETSLFNLEQGSNCEEDFLFYNFGEGFFAHVTAVYNPGAIESTFSETIFIEGPLLSINTFEKQKAIIYPNPTDGLLTIENKDISKIEIYNLRGSLIERFNATTQIDVSYLSKGIYIIKLISVKGTLIDKLIVK